MDGFELNKFAGAILLAGVVAMLAGFVSRMLIPEPHLEQSLIVASGVAEDAGAAPEEEAPQPIGPLLASASVDEGMQVARKCTACHTFEEGGPNKVGPNLWNVVGADKAHLDDYSYSRALADMEGTWTYEALDEFLLNPRGYVPGTKMSFAGLRSIDERAAVVAYMRSLSHEPQPLPEPAAEAPAEQPAEQPSDAAGVEAPADAAAAGEPAAAPAGESEAAAPEATTEPRTPAAEPSVAPTEGAAPSESPAPRESPAPAEQPAAPPSEAAPDGAQAPAAAPEQTTEQATAPATEQAEPSAAPAATAEADSPAALFRVASVEDGAKAARKCAACHTFNKDGPNRVGPNLWNVVGAPIGHRDDYRYSKAMEEAEGDWTYQMLFDYLENPRQTVPGTKMTFAGLKNPEELAAMVAYMRSMADEPAPLD